jgi:hypothetical protein
MSTWTSVPPKQLHIAQVEGGKFELSIHDSNGERKTIKDLTPEKVKSLMRMYGFGN